MTTLVLTLTTGTYAVEASALVGVDTVTMDGNTVPMIVSLPFVPQPQAVLVTNNGDAPVVLLRNIDSVAVAAGGSRLVLLTGNDLGPSIVDTSVNVGTEVAWDDVTSKPAFIGAGTSAALARTAIGAGTSSLALGTTSTTAKAGDYAPPNAGAATRGLVLQAVTQAASVAADVPALLVDFNALLTKLKNAGVMA